MLARTATNLDRTAKGETAFIDGWDRDYAVAERVCARPGQ
jgi:hypothetical protein